MVNSATYMLLFKLFKDLLMQIFHQSQKILVIIIDFFECLVGNSKNTDHTTSVHFVFRLVFDIRLKKKYKDLKIDL